MNQETPSAGQPAASGPLGTAQSIRPYAQPAMAWVVLVVCLLGTAVGWRLSLHQLAQRSHDRFILHTERVLRGIEARMQGYEQVLKGAVGLFAASKSVERAEWRDYVSRLEINKRYPGIRALGYIAHVPLGNVESFIMSNRVDGAGEFAVQPAATGNRSSRYVMQFIEPLEGNSASVGYDIASESRQREAAELARDRNETVLTARIKLVQSYEDLPAVLLLVPVYKNGWPVQTLEQRRAAIDGWVCAAFIMADLMAGVIESSDPEIDFEIFDGNRASLQSVLYDDDGILHGVGPESSTYHTNAPPLSLANRTWTIHFSTRPAFDAATDESETRLLAFGGVFISFLLFGITRSLVSTRRRALDLAQQMTEQFRIRDRAVVSSNDGIFITDASEMHNPILYANPAMEKITGFEVAEILGRSPEFLMGDETDPRELRELRAAIAEGRQCRAVLRSYRKDGTPFWNELSVSPVRDELGIVNHFVGISEDISDRKRAEETMRTTSALQRAILDSAGYAVISTSPEGVIDIFNSAAERITGFKAAEVVGKPASVLIHDWTEVKRRAEELSAELGRPVEPGFEVFIARALTGGPDEHEWTYVRKDGSELPVLLSVTAVRDEHGVLRGFMGIASDITGRKRAEAQLQQATLAAKAASRAKSEFLANMSHEIRTPMNAVMGMTELALGTELSREQRGYLAAARNSATDLLTIINDVLDFSKIEAGKLELVPEPFQLRDALGLGLKMFSLRAAEKGLELTLRVHPGVPESVIGDVGRLRQIVNNLVGNALKFTERGEVAVDVSLAGTETALLAAKNKQPAAHARCLLHFRVLDTGIGVPFDKQKTIFEAFTQADASVTRQYGGTGLGLAIADQLCRLMGGEIWVESEAGQGSRFHFTAGFDLPADGGSAPSPALREAAGEQVLIVDDNETSRRILSELFSQWQMVPIAAADSREAREILKGCSANGTGFRFAVIDAVMPGDEPFALVHDLQHGTGPVPAIIMLVPSPGNAAELKRCREAGIDTCLIKPVGESELLEAILRRTGTRAERVEDDHLPVETSPGARPLRVLLAEDNAVNRELATTVLRKMGHKVVTALNGQQAIDSWRGGGFDAILMDVQMPAVDGLEATAIIRRMEQGTGRHVPIIGLTAHAMKGDREHGLAAGMDEYLTKPLQMEDLSAAIGRWASLVGPAAAKIQPAFYPDRLLEALGGDEGASRKLLSIFLETTPALLKDVRLAVAERAAPRLERAAHTLKGSFMQVGGTAVASAAGELEQRARAGEMETTPALLVKLQEALEPFMKSAQDWLLEVKEAK